MSSNLGLLLYCLVCKSVWAGYEFSAAKCRQYSGHCESEPRPVMPLIVGGDTATSGEFPHMALIGFGQQPDLQWDCGGALISETFILTAAHCAKSRAFGPAVAVRLGLTHRYAFDKNMQERAIAHIHVHPSYKRPIKYHDIALMQLNAPVDFNQYVRPACINTDKNIVGVPMVIGFGKVKFSDAKGHGTLQKVDLPVLANEICQPFFKSMRVSTLNKGGLIDTQICAGTLTGGKDACQGDSGGPLHVYVSSPLCNYNIVGVTSFGKFCGFAKSPGIYTRVYSYVPWIVKIVWGV